MARHLLTAAVVLADVAIALGGRPSLREASAYVLALALIVVLRQRSALVAFAGALALASLSGAAYVLLLWVGYQAGREVVSRLGTVAVVGAALGALAGQVATRPWEPRTVAFQVAAFLVFVALPLLVGRYIAQHERLVSTLEKHNRQLRWQREVLAEQERLRERLRIARDMHDSLGHRLSLVSVQAAALEVSSLPPAQHQAVRQLARAARSAMDELHDLVGTLRAPDIVSVDNLIQEFQAAGVAVTVRRQGQERPLPESAYRVVEEGLTNATKHAPGQAVTVDLVWESDALVVTVVNPLAVTPEHITAGHGLSGLDERVRQFGGFLDHRAADGEFRLVAMLPMTEEAADDVPRVGRIRTVVLGLATAALMFVFLPASMLLGTVP